LSTTSAAAPQPDPLQRSEDRGFLDAVAAVAWALDGHRIGGLERRPRDVHRGGELLLEFLNLGLQVWAGMHTGEMEHGPAGEVRGIAVHTGPGSPRWPARARSWSPAPSAT
jgi:hypothetical protein